MLSSILAAITLLPQPQGKLWTLALGGDVMLNQVSVKNRPLAAVAPFLRESDLAIVNLEIPMTNAIAKTPYKSAEAVRRRFQFILRADPKHVGSLAGCGIDAVSLGNNHAMDFRAAGLAQMIGLLDAKGIKHSGAGITEEIAKKPAILKGLSTPRIKFISFLGFKTPGGLANCTPAKKNSAGVATLGFTSIGEAERKKVAEIVAAAKKDSDFLIVALHWGTERVTTPDSFQVALGRAFIDAGADVVVGHHPHVLQGVEVYKGKPILYSAGNLVSPRPSSTAVFRLAFSGTKFTSIAALPCRISGGKTATLTKKQNRPALESIRSLCNTVQKRFPNKYSENPYVLLAAAPIKT